MDTVVVVDFGGQYCHLIARRVRDLGVYSEILPFDATVEQIDAIKPVGFILSGGPSSVYEENAPHLPEEFFAYRLKHHIPLLGLCYGHQLIAQALEGGVEGHEEKEYGKAQFNPTRTDFIFEGLSAEETVWMSHGDQVSKLPPGFELFGTTSTCPIAAMGHIEEKIYGFQFHPEVNHTPRGEQMLRNFIFKVCNAKGEWKIENWVDQAIANIQATVGDNKVILGLSGGVDSSVVAMLLRKAIGERVHLIFVNNGVLRKNEAENVIKMFRDEYKFPNFHYVDAEDEFLTNLKDVEEPEKKRTIIGHTFIDVFERKAKELGVNFPNIKFLAQGTIYPDRVESQGTSKSSAKIKSHHNLVMPEGMTLKVLEPIKELYKDEVRKLGTQLGLPEVLITRHPFPGPGLAVRCLGAIDKEKLEILREADAIVIEEIRNAGLYNDVWQAFAVFIPAKTVGVMGDFRTYDYLCGLRIVNSIDAMTANFAKLDWDLLEKISTRIINEVRGFNRVVYDISNKPPSTIEFE